MGGRQRAGPQLTHYFVILVGIKKEKSSSRCASLRIGMHRSRAWEAGFSSASCAHANALPPAMISPDVRTALLQWGGITANGGPTEQAMTENGDIVAG